MYINGAKYTIFSVNHENLQTNLKKTKYPFFERYKQCQSKKNATENRLVKHL